MRPEHTALSMEFSLLVGLLVSGAGRCHAARRKYATTSATRTGRHRADAHSTQRAYRRCGNDAKHQNGSEIESAACE